MLNRVVVVGRITNNLKLEQLENGKKFCDIILAIPRSYKNGEGKYDKDYISCKLWGGVAESTVEYCHKGDLVGIRGEIQSNVSKEKEAENKKIDISIVGDKVSFLTTSKVKIEPEIER